jgi:peptidoglycan/xylan/chitin deacetylase (PgdA/CDA1 family)
MWTVPILSYHRVGEPKGDHVPTVSPESFERQLAFMARHRYRVLSLAELVDHMEHGQPIERRSVAMTFDDGYEETASVAAPLLRRFGFCATVFVTPTEIGLPGFMTWDQLQAVVRDGVVVGSHTLHHTYLPLASSQQVTQELVESKQTLERRLGRRIELLSYPIGGFTPEIQAIAKASGYRAACTTNRARSRMAHDLFALRRIKMTERDRHPILLWAKLSGYYDLFRRLEHPA